VLYKKYTDQELEDKIGLGRYSCRICDMMTANLALWVDLHEKVLMENNPMQSVVDFANDSLKTLFEVGKIDEVAAKEITQVQLRKHFNQHVATIDIFQRLLKTALKIQGARCTDDETMREHDTIKSRMGLDWDSVDEFVQLRALLTAAEVRISQYDERMKDMEGRPGYVVDFKMVKEYQQLVTDHLKNRTELLKLQNSLAVAGKAVETAIAAVAKAFINEAAQVSDEAAAMVSREHPGSSVSEEVAALIRSRLGDSLKAIIQDAHTVILKQYGIK
jgi:membrane peptidoglycan carboxypeptidase